MARWGAAESWTTMNPWELPRTRADLLYPFVIPESMTTLVERDPELRSRMFWLFVLLVGFPGLFVFGMEWLLQRVRRFLRA